MNLQCYMLNARTIPHKIIPYKVWRQKEFDSFLRVGKEFDRKQLNTIAEKEFNNFKRHQIYFNGDILNEYSTPLHPLFSCIGAFAPDLDLRYAGLGYHQFDLYRNINIFSQLEYVCDNNYEYFGDFKNRLLAEDNFWGA